MEKFLIVDGNSLANRAFYAMPYLSNRDSRPSGAVFGFANLLVKIIQDVKPKYVAVAFDHARKTFRNEIYADYKGTRKATPDDLLVQFPIIKNMLELMNIKFFECEGIEADDIIGTIAKSSGMENILLSGDRDLLQLIDDSTTVWLTRKGVSEVEKFDKSHLKEVWKIEPYEVVDLKALMGDASDNIPGVAGVGEKTALSLLERFDGLDGVYENISQITGKLNEKLVNGKQMAYLSKRLATIKTDCDINFKLSKCELQFPFSQDLRNFFEYWDFRTFLHRKDIFQEGVGVVRTDAKKVEFGSLEEVVSLKNRVKNFFCMDLKNMEFSVGGDEFYCIKREIDLFSPNLDFDEVLNIFKPIFEDKNILKITNSSKDDIKYLKKRQIGFENFFDIEIAEYVLYAGLPKGKSARVGEFSRLQKELTQKMAEMGVAEIYSKIEIPLVSVLADMEEEGFKVDESVLEQMSQKYDAEISVLTQKIYELAGGEFNLNSPKQMAEVLFDKLGLVSYNNKKRSTSFDVLDEMRTQHEIVGLIIDFRKVSKLVSTYLNVYKSICRRDGAVIRTVFNQTLTSTGRLSSSEPNMQNIPARDQESRSLRKIFISKYPNGKIISADYNQIELRLLANMAKEDSMIEAYKSGVDIHTKTASEIFGVPVEQVTAEQRRDAKAVNFGIIYGISDFGLSQNIKTSRMRAKNYIENYFDRYPKIRKFMNEGVEFAKENGYIKSFFGRIRHIPEIQSSNGNVRRFGERVAMNMPLQGTASDVIKMAMIKVWQAFQERKLKSHLILQVHDELIVDAPEDEVELVEKLLKEIMENVCEFEIPLTVSVGSGNNLLECK